MGEEGGKVLNASEEGMKQILSNSSGRNVTWHNFLENNLDI